MSLASLLTTVQYYTQADPYYYTVDNRPLQNLNDRDVTIANTLDQRTNILQVTGSATPTIVTGPAGWTISVNGVGDYTVTHTLGTNNFAVILGMVGTPGFVTLFSQTSTQFRIQTFNTAGVATHLSFAALVSQYGT